MEIETFFFRRLQGVQAWYYWYLIDFGQMGKAEKFARGKGDLYCHCGEMVFLGRLMDGTRQTEEFELGEDDYDDLKGV